MIVGLGIDLVEIGRIRAALARFGRRFAQKVCTEAELAVFDARPDPAPYLAAVFASKEAAVKALGTGFRQGVHLHTLEVRHLPSGKPELVLLGRAAERAASLGADRAHVSMTHERGMASAVVILEGG
ncbi:MAG: holo-ACP synthase [Desulfovibrionaceae bacterium]